MVGAILDHPAGVDFEPPCPKRITYLLASDDQPAPRTNGINVNRLSVEPQRVLI